MLNLQQSQIALISNNPWVYTHKHATTVFTLKYIKVI